MSTKSNFIKALRGEPVDKVPVWCMRQAGRYMADYQQIRGKYGFLEMVKTPELAAEVTLQPLRQFGFDAAIIFSDILVVAESLGVKYDIVEGKGPVLERSLREKEDLRMLKKTSPEESLAYVGEAVKLVKSQIDRPLLGFAPAPWTLAAYMITGESSKDFAGARSWAFSHPKLYSELMKILTEQIVSYLLFQVESGVDAIQVFDTWGDLWSQRHYPEFNLQWLERLFEELKKEASVPAIFYSRRSSLYLELLKKLPVDCFSLDWTVDMNYVRDITGRCVQGNLDPAVLLTNRETVEREVRTVLGSISCETQYIFNLGHGVYPQTPEENMKVLVDTVHAWRVRDE